MKSLIKILVAGIGLFIFDSHIHAQSFVLASSPSVGSEPQCVIAADVNGDGKTDLISVNIGDNTLSVLTNNGSGGFALANTYMVGNYSYGYGFWPQSPVTATDFNGDGKVDLVCVNFGGNTLTVLTNNGNGNFGSNATLNVGSEPISVTAADVNGDGKADLICVNFGDDTISVLTNNGVGKFTLASSQNADVSPSTSATYSVTAADVNGDGKVDLICRNDGYNTLTVLTNKGSGSFGYSSTYTFPYPPFNGPCPYSIAVVDVNGDGKPDLVCAVPYSSSGNLLAVLTNNGSGGFMFETNYVISGQSSLIAVTVADVNGDGKMDLICDADDGSSGNALMVLTNNGSGRFGFYATNDVGNSAYSIAVADVNGDGKPDLICANYGDNTLTVLFKNTFLSRAATATAVFTNGFVVTATITDAGYGYTNAPIVSIVGGGGSGAQATATISNGIVTAIIIVNAGSGYTSAPNIVISPPFVALLNLGIGPAVRLDFTNLAVGSNYQLQVSQSGIWANLGSSFVSVSNGYSQYADWAGGSLLYRLAVMPIQQGAMATPTLDFGFVVAATVTSGGSGYVSIPTVNFVGGGGSGAQATATVSNGIVTAIKILNAGSGYTNAPTIQIDPPPVSALLPVITKAFRLDYSGLTITLAYQLQGSPNLAGWTNFGSGFTATANTNSQYLNFGTGSQFFRLMKP
jgi:hypothetical protein